MRLLIWGCIGLIWHVALGFYCKILSSTNSLHDLPVWELADAATAMTPVVWSHCIHFSSRLIKAQRSRLRHRRPLIPRHPQPASRLFRRAQRAASEPERGCYDWALLCLLCVIILSSSCSRSAPASVIKIFIYLIWKLLFALIPNDFL